MEEVGSLLVAVVERDGECTWEQREEVFREGS